MLVCVHKIRTDRRPAVPQRFAVLRSRSLGCLLFQLVTGDPPFPSVGLDLEGFKAKVCSADFALPSEVPATESPDS